MATRRAICRLTALAAATVSLAAAASAAADRDRYGNELYFGPAACNPTGATLRVATFDSSPIFVNGVAWVDYFGLPVAVLPPFRVQPDASVRGWSYRPPWPSELPPGRYTMHALLQGNTEIFGGLLALVFTTVSATASVDPGLNPDCTPATEPSPRVLARRVEAARRTADLWAGASLGSSVPYPKARLCGSTVCVKRHAAGAWAALAGR